MFWNNGFIEEGSLDYYPQTIPGGWIYEVIRVMEGSPVFIREHLDRLWKAAKITDLPMLFTQAELIQGIFRLISSENIKSGNLRIQISIKEGYSLIGIIPHKYPKAEQYRNGVVVDLAGMERQKPNIKSWNREVRQNADRIIREKNIYEVILISPEGFLLEGSRSNIFGLKKGSIITPPRKQVLPGITRQIIMDICHENLIPVREESIHRSDLHSFQSFFLTGTSPGILPIRRIGNIHFNCHSTTCDSLRDSFDRAVLESIAESNPLKN